MAPPLADAGGSQANAAYEALHNRPFTDRLLGRGYPPELGFDPAAVTLLGSVLALKIRSVP